MYIEGSQSQSYFWLCVKAHAAGSKRQVHAGRIRKLVPTIPSTLKAYPQVPDAIVKMAAGCTDPALLLLQNAFLDMYSASQQSVILPAVTSPSEKRWGVSICLYVLNLSLLH
jgi:hypothetical protein